MRVSPKGGVYKQVNIEIPANLHRRLEIEKTRRNSSFRDLLLEWIMPRLNALPEEPVQHSNE